MKININGIFIIIANSVGAGLLGIPITCCLSGFFPSIAMMLFIALYMNITAKLITKITFIYKSDNIINISNNTIGKPISIVSSLIFILLFSSILSAYLSKSSDLIKLLFDPLLNCNINKNFYYFCIVLTTIMIINFKKKQFNNINNILVIIFIVILILLCYVLINNMDTKNLIYYKVENIKYTYPILITSFGFHNVLPYIKKISHNYHDTKRLINIGVFFTFLIYFLWIVVILSVMPSNNDNIVSAYNYDKIITELIISYTNYDFMYIIINAFAFLAILTSILGISLSMKLFLKKLLNLHGTVYNKLILMIIIFVPSILMNYIYKNIFFAALNMSGGILALILFGLLPALIVIKNKEKKFKKKTLFKAIILTIITILAMVFFLISDI